MTDSTIEHVDILIIGAGPVGMTLHLALTAGGQSSLLLDRRPPAALQADPRALALSHGARELLEQINSWPTRAATPIETIHVSQKDGFGRTLIDRADYALPALGYVVRYRDLAAALAAVVLGYGLLFGIQAVFGVDFRIWTLAVRTFKVEHLLVALRYLPVFFIYYFVNTVALNANTRGRRGGTALAIGLNIGGLVVWLALQYGLDFATGVAMYPAQALNGILLVALAPCLAITSGRRPFIVAGGG